jgi:hypothetical protein
MFRRSRTIAALVRHLTLGLVGTSVVVGAGSVLIGCEDENQPEYWIKKLNDPVSQAPAIKRLGQFYTDGLNKAGNKKDDPTFSALMAKIVGPMTKIYIEGNLDEKTRTDLLRILADMRDDRVKDAIIKATKDFAAGKATAEEMKLAAKFITSMKLQAAEGVLLDAFLHVKVKEKSTGPAYLQIKEALMTIPSKSWEAKLIETISRPMKMTDQNELYWQSVSATLLGELRSEKAVRPLFKMVLDNEKSNLMGATAVMAITKIGKLAIPPLIKIMNNEDEEITKSSAAAAGKDKVKAQAHVATAAIALGTIGRKEAMDPMVAALKKAEFDTTKAIIGREMSKLPASPDTIKALQDAYAIVKFDTLVPPTGRPAKQVIANAATQFMDSSIVPWLVKEAETYKGPAEPKDAIVDALTSSAMMLMKVDQTDDVKKLIDKSKDKTDKANFEKCVEVLNSCKDKVGCYMGKLTDKKIQNNSKEQIKGVKAAYMLAMLGNDATKAEMVKLIPKIGDASIKAVVMLAIDHMSPNGDKKLADELQVIVDKHQATGDRQKIASDAPLRQIIPRLRARADK